LSPRLGRGSRADTRKKEIAEVDSVYRAKIAEREVFLKDQIRKAQIAGNSEEAQSLEKQLASEMRRLQDECEAKKEKLRASFAKL
jgi:ABC-type hemin transport system substrate-binding protein